MLIIIFFEDILCFLVFTLDKPNSYLKVLPYISIMGKRREVDEIAKLIYRLVKKNKTGELSVNQIAQIIKTRWDTAERALNLLLELGLVSKRVEGSKRNATKLFKFKR